MSLPRIPRDQWRLREGPPQFVRWSDAWCLLGTDTDLEPGRALTVARRGGQAVRVVVGEILAERVVRHQEDSRYGTGQRRYVVAAFTA